MKRKKKRRGKWPHEDLLPWKKSRALTVQVYRLTRKLPRSEKIGLQSQMRRAAVSVVSNIAEGAARQTDREFVRFLFISRASLSELATQVGICEDLGYFTAEEADDLHYVADNVCYFINRLIKTKRSNGRPS